jgi:hypothetical protein
MTAPKQQYHDGLVAPWWVEFVIPFRFDGRLYREGGVVLTFQDGSRAAMTIPEFRNWQAAVGR